MDSRILHVDMDAFFAALEQGANPHLAGRPVVVGGGPGNRGIVTTASYECRPHGVRSGMSAATARRLCPAAVFVPVNGRHYSYVSKQLHAVYSEFASRVQVVSVDEAFLDVTGTAHLFGGELALGQRLKDRIRDRFNLTCSLGIAPNKLLAKLASTVFKPDGLTTLTRDDLPHVIHHLPVERISGVGPTSLKNLHRIDIRTIGDLVSLNESRLERCLGNFGIRLQRKLRGESHSIVLPDDEQPQPKSVGHEMTFAADIGDRSAWTAILIALAHRVGRRLRRHGLSGRTVTLKYRFANFTTKTRRKTLPVMTDESRVIFDAARSLLGEALSEPALLRLLGVTISNLTPVAHGIQQSLFDPVTFLRRRCTDDVIDALQDRYGSRIISSGRSTLVPVR